MMPSRLAKSSGDYIRKLVLLSARYSTHYGPESISDVLRIQDYRLNAFSTQPTIEIRYRGRH